MSQHGRPTRLDGFEVVRTGKSPGMVMAEQDRRVTLHNAEDPCGSVASIKHPVTVRLGADHSPRDELYRFCDRCDWPADRQLLHRTLMTVPEPYR